MKKVVDSYVDLVKDIFTQTGSISSSIAVIGTEKANQQNAVIKIVIEPAYLSSEEMKDKFMHDVIPGASQQIKERFDVYAVVWASEAWVRSVKKEDAHNTSVLENWKELPIEKEVLIITVESKGSNEVVILDIVRNGHQVNDKGELVEDIQLKELPEYKNAVSGEGRFTGLLQKFT